MDKRRSWEGRAVLDWRALARQPKNLNERNFSPRAYAQEFAPRWRKLFASTRYVLCKKQMSTFIIFREALLRTNQYRLSWLHQLKSLRFAEGLLRARAIEKLCFYLGCSRLMARFGTKKKIYFFIFDHRMD